MESYDFKKEYIKILKIMRANIISLVWLFTAFVIATTYLGIGFKAGLYSLCIITAVTLAPTGDKSLKWVKGIRQVETKKDKEYLMPIFNEVFTDIKRNNRELSPVTLCISNSMEISVEGLGSNTLHVTQGAVQTYSERNLKGLMAREIGRIVKGYTKGLMLNDIANKLFVVVVVLIKIASWIYEIGSLALLRYFGLDEIFILIFLSFEVLSIVIFVFITSFVQVLISIHNKSNDHIADRFAFENGYGAELTECLYSIRELTQEQKGFWKRLKSGQAIINKRIALLEALEDMQDQ